jgi:protein gp37
VGESTAISWTDHTFNPWWGCWKIAPECANCYADELANRYAPGHWGRTAPRRFFKDGHWSEPRKWNRAALRDGVRRRVFVGSMCDWAEAHPDPATASAIATARRRLFNLIGDCTALDWLLLTKRPESARELVPWMATVADWQSVGVSDGKLEQIADPWPHVWLGVSAGHRDSLDKIETLRGIPAAVRFVSCEPILSDITASEWDRALGHAPRLHSPEDPTRIHWLIVGDESAAQSRVRRANLEWVRVARDAAARSGVAFHFKQWCGPDAPGLAGRAEPRGKIHLPILDGRQHAAFPERK